MKKRTVNFILFVTMFAFALTYLSGCAKPPTKEMEQAEKALAEAKQKEVDFYVKDLFGKAEESLKKAKDLIDTKKYKEAKKAAEEVSQLIQQATSMVEQNKAKIKAEVEQAIQEVTKEIAELKPLLAKVIRKMKAEEQKETQGMIGKWELEMVTIKEMFQGEKLRQASDGIKPIKEQVLAQKEKLKAPAEAKPEKK